ncbi:UDP-galactose transporter [Wickerhamomyces ciferrii]|uniref:UDP-galactose transporter homolog 1 n=1 Tax=Wickerhamomyces ciferrii (strain ATCC 14091 / BCRC 22168 / CBS 111 / JCM 3599 / NBRC 0793 / NRRL Y-1031 F-60-10) TaxID=1206466 RepID=K0KP54_WICCF|nr:UDP-galactose transporter [Wickerhamomyces ciferrii]CCH42898.1 UDP-galactose transporter [Wickerhamomyces ciferrii]
MNNTLTLFICITGIYTSFITWGYLQEQITIQKFGPNNEQFHAPFIINLVQNLFGFIVGYIYLYWKTSNSTIKVSIFNKNLIKSLVLISLTQSLSSPIGLSSTNHLGYLLYTLSKSCKLIPVMIVQYVLYQKRFPRYKYLVVGIVTIGVVLFTLGLPSKKNSSDINGNLSIGLLYIFISLLLDGLTNSLQDDLFKKNQNLSGAHLMTGLNLVSFILTLGYTTILSNQLKYSIDFISQYPSILKEIVLYAVCGALGQIFIFITLEKFGSLILVTITVTRKMISMLLSVFLFGHDLNLNQWSGLFLVFGGIGLEAYLKLNQKKQSTITTDTKKEK